MDEQDVFKAAKRLGIQRCPWMGDWFVSWSPRNSNSNAEGTWFHWVNLAKFILSHEATSAVSPADYMPELKPNTELHTGGPSLSEESIQQLFPQENP